MLEEHLNAQAFVYAQGYRVPLGNEIERARNQQESAASDLAHSIEAEQNKREQEHYVACRKKQFEGFIHCNYHLLRPHAFHKANNLLKTYDSYLCASAEDKKFLNQYIEFAREYQTYPPEIVKQAFPAAIGSSTYFGRIEEACKIAELTRYKESMQQESKTVRIKTPEKSVVYAQEQSSMLLDDADKLITLRPKRVEQEAAQLTRAFRAATDKYKKEP